MAPNTLSMLVDYVNLITFETSQGLVLMEAGPKILEEIRKHTDAPLHTVIFLRISTCTVPLAILGLI